MKPKSHIAMLAAIIALSCAAAALLVGGCAKREEATGAKPKPRFQIRNEKPWTDATYAFAASPGEILTGDSINAGEVTITPADPFIQFASGLKVPRQAVGPFEQMLIDEGVGHEARIKELERLVKELQERLEPTATDPGAEQ